MVERVRPCQVLTPARAGIASQRCSCKASLRLMVCDGGMTVKYNRPLKQQQRKTQYFIIVTFSGTVKQGRASNSKFESLGKERGQTYLLR